MALMPTADFFFNNGYVDASALGSEANGLYSEAKVGVTPDAGPGYVLGGDGSSCYGQTSGADNTLATDFAASATKYDTPVSSALKPSTCWR